MNGNAVAQYILPNHFLSFLAKSSKRSNLPLIYFITIATVNVDEPTIDRKKPAQTKNTEFSLFKNVIDSKGIINAIVVENAADKYSRKQLDALNDIISSDYYHIIWLNTNKSKNDLGSYYDRIIQVMLDNKVKLDLMDGN